MSLTVENKTDSTINVYHGSGVRIVKFDFRFTEQGNDQLGSGFYFTTDEDEANYYAIATINNLPKLGGDSDPTIHKVSILLTNPLPATKVQSLKSSQVRQIISSAPKLDECLGNWGDVEFEGREKLIRQAVSSYCDCDEVLVKTLCKLSNDFYPGDVQAFNNVITKVLGYDGVVMSFEDKTHYVAWFPEQITVLETYSRKNELTPQKLRPRI